MIKKFMHWFYFIIVIVCFLSPLSALAEECIVITSPVENATVIGKRPEIKGVFRCPLTSGSYVVMLDGVDITQLLDVTSEGFTYRPETMAMVAAVPQDSAKTMVPPKRPAAEVPVLPSLPLLA